MKSGNEDNLSELGGFARASDLYDIETGEPHPHPSKKVSAVEMVCKIACVAVQDGGNQ